MANNKKKTTNWTVGRDTRTYSLYRFCMNFVFVRVTFFCITSYSKMCRWSVAQKVKKWFWHCFQLSWKLNPTKIWFLFLITATIIQIQQLLSSILIILTTVPACIVFELLWYRTNDIFPTLQLCSKSRIKTWLTSR